MGWGDPDWDIPWVQNKVTLGTMARWKALYLISGYDRVWQTMRSMQDLVKPSQEIVPPVMHLDDGTRADGNWSAREICNVLQMPTGVYEDSITVSYGQLGVWWVTAYSMYRLLVFLQRTSGLLGNSPDRPLSFRALLAACDDESYGLPLTPGG